MAHEFDPDRLELRVDSRPIGEVLRESGNWGVIASASDNGVLLFQSAGEVKYPVSWWDRNGRSLGPAPISAQLVDLRLSPDMTRAAVSSFEAANGDLSFYDLKTGARARLTGFFTVLHTWNQKLGLNPRPSPPGYGRCSERTGWCTRNHLSVALSMCSSI